MGHWGTVQKNNRMGSVPDPNQSKRMKPHTHTYCCQKTISLSPTSVDQTINRSKAGPATRTLRCLVQGDSHCSVHRGHCSIYQKQHQSEKLSKHVPKSVHKFTGYLRGRFMFHLLLPLSVAKGRLDGTQIQKKVFSKLFFPLAKTSFC